MARLPRSCRCGNVHASGERCPSIGVTLPYLKGWGVTRSRILQRDNYTCYLCGRYGADSVDHIIARTNGGSDNDDNLAAAHLTCNMMKGVKMVKASENLAWAESVGIAPKTANNSSGGVFGKFGALAETIPDLIRPLATYGVLSDLPSTDKPFRYGENLQYPMACNDSIGDCTIAGIIHAAQIWALIAGVDYTYPGDTVTSDFYYQLTGGPDSGLQLSTVISACSQPNPLGFELIGAATVDINDYDLMRQALYNFGCLYWAFEVPQSAETDFAESKPWALLSPPDQNILGGHCTVANGTQRETQITPIPKGNLYDHVTWAAQTEMTQGFYEYYGEQAYVLIPKWFATCGHDALQKLDQAQMLEDIHQIGTAKVAYKATVI